MESTNILWVDPDHDEISHYVAYLKNRGYSITLADSLSEGEQLLLTKEYEILILDVMITPTQEEEDTHYPAASTKKGYESGVVFFDRVLERVQEKRTKVLIFTLRFDQEVVNAFMSRGIERGAILSKTDINTMGEFQTIISSLRRDSSR